ncbi:MAG: DUF6783 domain-containing protein [Lacrimispora saccharolytica]
MCKAYLAESIFQTRSEAFLSDL